MFTKRPHPGETEEDLMAMQKEFLANKKGAGGDVTGISEPKEPSAKDSTRQMALRATKPSGFASFKPASQSRDMEEAKEDSLGEIEEMTDPVPVVTEIKENVIGATSLPSPPAGSQLLATADGFPATFVVYQKSDKPSEPTPAKTTKAKSLFAQRLADKKKRTNEPAGLSGKNVPARSGTASPAIEPSTGHQLTPGPPATIGSFSGLTGPNRFEIQTGNNLLSVMDDDPPPRGGLAMTTGSSVGNVEELDGDRGSPNGVRGKGPHSPQTMTATIDEENRKKLEQMTEEEIVQQREEILKKIDPKLVEFLKSQRNRKTTGGTIGDPSEQLITPTAGYCRTTVEMDGEPSPVTIRSVPEDQISSRAKDQSDALSDAQSKESVHLPAELIDWTGLAKLEEDKLEWLKPVGLRKEHQVETVRFDFHGNIAYAAVSQPDRALQSGLHHHGNQPESPGYTLEELLPLCRSAVLNQRLLALRVLAKIVAKAKLGLFDAAVSPNLLEKLIHCDVGLLIRTAIDENIATVCESGFNLLAAFMHQPYDEGSMDRYQFCSVGLWMEEFQPDHKETDPDASESDTDDRTQSDSDACKLDFVKGFLRMGMLSRVRYVLEVFRPLPANLIACVFHCLVRSARHSAEASGQIMDCPRLLNVVLDQFVPFVWTSVADDSSNYPKANVPYWGAVKLLRILISSSNKIASQLAEDERLEKAILRYISCEPRDLMLPPEQACQLVVEAYRLWTVMVCYGHWHFKVWDMYHILMRHMQITCSPESLNAASLVNRKFTLDRAACAATLIEKHVLTIGVARKDELVQGFCQGFYELMNHMVRFHVTVVHDDSLSVKESLLDLIGACLACCAALVQQAVDVSASLVYDLVTSCTALAAGEFQIFSTKYSHLANQSYVPCESNLPCLPCLPSVSRNCERLHPFITAGCPMALLDGYFRAVNVLRSKELFVEMSQFCESAVIRKFFQKFIKSHLLVPHQSVTLYHRLEIAFLVKFLWSTWGKNEILYLATLKLVSLVDLVHSSTVLHLIGKLMDSQTVRQFDCFNKLLPSLKPDDEAKKLLHPEPDWESDAAERAPDKCHVMCLAYGLDRLEDICASFVQSAEMVAGTVFVSSESSHLDGTSFVFCDEIKLGTLVRPKSEFLFAAQNFWIFQPIASAKESTQLLQSQGESVKGVSDAILGRIRHCLAWVYLVLAVDQVPLADWMAMTDLYRHITDIFWIGPDVYKDSVVRVYLWRLLKVFISKLDSENLTGNYDLQHYESLVNLFESTSYGDELFGHYVLLATAGRFPNAANSRQVLWSDEKMVLRSLAAEDKEMLFPVSEFVPSKELSFHRHEKLMILYVRALASNVKRGCFVEQIAVRNVRAARLDEQPLGSSGRKLWDQILMSKDKFPALFHDDCSDV